MLGNDSHRPLDGLTFVIWEGDSRLPTPDSRLQFVSGYRGNAIHDGIEQIGFINGLLALHYSCGALQSHAGINVRPGQRGAIPPFILVVLGEDQIPDFRKAAAAAGGAAVRLATTNTEVIQNLTARPAGTAVSRRSPEVILLAAASNPPSRYPDIEPVIKSLIVVKEDRYPEALLRQVQTFGHEFPCPGDGLLLEVVAHAEVAQHLEESQVPGVSDRINVSGAEAFLARHQAGAG